MRLQVIDPHVKFSCSSCTLCCEQPWQTVIEAERLPAIDAVDWGAAFPALRDKTLYHQVRENGRTVYQLAKGEGVKCVFLDDDKKCIIHKKLGYDAKPHMCKQFPFIPARAWDADYVSANFGCRAVQNQHGEPMTAQADAVADIVPVANRPANADARVMLTPETSVPQRCARALMERMGGHFVDANAGTIVDRFAAALTMLNDALATDPDALEAAVRDGDVQPTPPTDAIAPYERPTQAPMASRFLLAATLFPDTLPRNVRSHVGFFGRLALVPKLMTLARMQGGYASRLLDRNVSIGAVFDAGFVAAMSPEATALLGRYLRSRLWQQLPGGTQLPIYSAMHQHILDAAAVTFFARAELLHTGGDALDLPVVQRALTLVEFHLSNQNRLYNQVLKGWLKTSLATPALAAATLRLIHCGVPAEKATDDAMEDAFAVNV